MIIKCDICGKEFNRNPNAIKQKNFCSISCYLENNIKNKNEINIKDTYAEIIINNNKYGVKKALIDIEDIEKAQNIYWNCHRINDRYYVVGYNKITKKRTQSLHRYILGNCEELEIDHINRNPLDNRKCNLRFVTKSENQLNKKCQYNNKIGYKGIRIRDNGTYQARIMINGKSISIGHFKSLNEAILARNNYCINNNIIA